jgi:hypothetical protein
VKPSHQILQMMLQQVCYRIDISGTIKELHVVVLNGQQKLRLSVSPSGNVTYLPLLVQEICYIAFGRQSKEVHIPALQTVPLTME